VLQNEARDDQRQRGPISRMDELQRWVHYDLLIWRGGHSIRR
jgi:hypothetical protein